MMSEEVVVSWSGGKDAALALRACRRDSATEVVELLTTVTAETSRVSMHGVRQTLLERQAAALDLPLRTVALPTECSNEEYQARMAPVLADYAERGVSHVVFADIHLEDVRAYRESRLEETSLDGRWPLWGRDTAAIVREFLDAGFQATTVCVADDPLGPEGVATPVDQEFLAGLPEDVDPCGENGEFHTFVHDGPVFSYPVPVETGERVTKSVGDETLHYCDLLLTE